MWIRVCRYKNTGVVGYAEAFRPVQSDSQTSEWYSYFENDVLVICTIIIKGNIVIVDKDSLIIHFVCDKAFFFFAIKSHDPLTRNIIHTPVPVAVCHFRICKKPQCNTDISGMSFFNNGFVCAPVLYTYVKFISAAFIQCCFCDPIS